MRAARHSGSRDCLVCWRWSRRHGSWCPPSHAVKYDPLADCSGDKACSKLGRHHLRATFLSKAVLGGFQPDRSPIHSGSQRSLRRGNPRRGTRGWLRRGRKGSDPWSHGQKGGPDCCGESRRPRVSDHKVSPNTQARNRGSERGEHHLVLTEGEGVLPKGAGVGPKRSDYLLCWEYDIVARR